MPKEPMPAGGLPIVPVEPVPDTTPRLPALFRGDWCQDGGMVGRRGEYAVLQTRAGTTVMLDRRAVELAALALGVEIRR